MQLSEEQRLAKRIAPGIIAWREYNELSNQNFVYFYSKELLSGNFKKISPRDLIKMREIGVIKRVPGNPNASISEYGKTLLLKNGFDVEEPEPEQREKVAKEKPVEIVVVPRQRRKLSEAHRAKISKARRGRLLSAEHRLHMTKKWREAHEQTVG